MAKPSQRLVDPHFVSKLARLDLRARLVVDGFLTGLHKSPYHGFSVEFAEHRQYMPGDPLRHLDWKVLAKSDRKYLKQYEEETNLRATLLIDTSASMGYSSHGLSKLDYARQLAASLAYLMLRQNDAAARAARGLPDAGARMDRQDPGILRGEAGGLRFHHDRHALRSRAHRVSEQARPAPLGGCPACPRFRS